MLEALLVQPLGSLDDILLQVEWLDHSVSGVLRRGPCLDLGATACPLPVCNDANRPGVAWLPGDSVDSAYAREPHLFTTA